MRHKSSINGTKKTERKENRWENFDAMGKKKIKISKEKSFDIVIVFFVWKKNNNLTYSYITHA